MVQPQGEVRGQHGWRVTLARVVGIRNRAGACATLRLPLMRPSRALRQLPFVAERILEVIVAQLGGGGVPGYFRPVVDRATAFALGEPALPARACPPNAGRS